VYQGVSAGSKYSTTLPHTSQHLQGFQVSFFLCFTGTLRVEMDIATWSILTYPYTTPTQVESAILRDFVNSVEHTSPLQLVRFQCLIHQLRYWPLTGTWISTALCNSGWLLRYRQKSAHKLIFCCLCAKLHGVLSLDPQLLLQSNSDPKTWHRLKGL
jgi:hypothetical protein